MVWNVRCNDDGAMVTEERRVARVDKDEDGCKGEDSATLRETVPTARLASACLVKDRAAGASIDEDDGIVLASSVWDERKWSKSSREAFFAPATDGTCAMTSCSTHHRAMACGPSVLRLAPSIGPFVCQRWIMRLELIRIEHDSVASSH